MLVLSVFHDEVATIEFQCSNRMLKMHLVFSVLLTKIFSGKPLKNLWNKPKLQQIPSEILRSGEGLYAPGDN